MTRPLSFLSPTSLDLLLSMALRIAARTIGSGKFDDHGMNKYHPSTPNIVRRLMEEYLSRKEQQ